MQPVLELQVVCFTSLLMTQTKVKTRTDQMEGRTRERGMLPLLLLSKRKKIKKMKNFDDGVAAVQHTRGKKRERKRLQVNVCL